MIFKSDPTSFGWSQANKFGEELRMKNFPMVFTLKRDASEAIVHFLLIWSNFELLEKHSGFSC